MPETRSEADARTGISAAKDDTRVALPKLQVCRQRLEREAAARRATHFPLACAGGAGLVGAIAVLQMVAGSSPVITRAAMVALAVCSMCLHAESKRSRAEHRRELEELHSRILAAGRQIDRGERTLRRRIH